MMLLIIFCCLNIIHCITHMHTGRTCQFGFCIFIVRTSTLRRAVRCGVRCGAACCGRGAARPSFFFFSFSHFLRLFFNHMHDFRDYGTPCARADAQLAVWPSNSLLPTRPHLALQSHTHPAYTAHAASIFAEREGNTVFVRQECPPKKGEVVRQRTQEGVPQARTTSSVAGEEPRAQPTQQQQQVFEI